MTWLRRNRWWLPLMPVALLLLVAGSGFRLEEWWWKNDYREQIDRASAGHWAHWEDTNTLFDVGAERSFDVRLVGFERVSEVPMEYGSPKPLPDDSEGLLVELEFRKPVGDSSGCTLVLVDADGGYFGDWFGHLHMQEPCGPANYGEDPTATWTARSVVAVDPGVEIVEVRIGFGGTKYLSLEPPKA